MHLAFMSFQEWMIVAAIVLVLFGAKKIPELARSVGRAAGELQAGIKESQKMFKEAADEAKNAPEAGGTPTEHSQTTKD